MLPGQSSHFNFLAASFLFPLPPSPVPNPTWTAKKTRLSLLKTILWSETQYKSLLHPPTTGFWCTFGCAVLYGPCNLSPTFWLRFASHALTHRHTSDIQAHTSPHERGLSRRVTSKRNRQPAQGFPFFETLSKLRKKLLSTIRRIHSSSEHSLISTTHTRITTAAATSRQPCIANNLEKTQTKSFEIRLLGPPFLQP